VVLQNIIIIIIIIIITIEPQPSLEDTVRLHPVSVPLD
jgi:hypothetical protein